MVKSHLQASMGGVSSRVQLPDLDILKSMDWFKGNFTGKPHDLHGKI
jgi:hypothetical protein